MKMKGVHLGNRLLERSPSCFTTVGPEQKRHAFQENVYILKLTHPDNYQPISPQCSNQEQPRLGHISGDKKGRRQNDCVQ